MTHLAHALLAAVALHPFKKAFQIRVLDAEMEDARFPVFEVVGGLLGVRELEYFDTDAVARRQMGDAEGAPALAEHVVAHLADGAVVVADGGRAHDHVEPEYRRIELHGLV